jgi:predicted ferric reductase
MTAMNTLHSTVITDSQERSDPAHRSTPLSKRPSTDVDEVVMTALPLLVGALVGIATLIAVVVTLVGQAGGIAALSTALLGAHSAWYLSRASAFVAYVLLWWSMVLGLLITNHLARIWPSGPVAGDLHEHASLLGLGFGVLHALVLLGDQYIGYSLPQILFPFTSASYRPLWVGLGQISLYLLALVTLSFYVRRWIGARTWRLLHFLSFAVFVLALAHGLFSGTDSSAPWVVWMYLGSGLSVLGLTVYRVLVSRRAAAPKARSATARSVG